MNIQKKNQKPSILSKFCSYLGWNNQKEIDQNEIQLFLNKFSKDGQFDNNLSSQLFQYIGIEEDTKITVEEFINSYIQFEEELNKNVLEIKKKISDEQNSLNSYQEQCYKFKDEKLNSEGFSENAKISIEITDIEIKQILENINEIILYLVYNSERKQLRFEYSNDIIKFYEQLFEFKSTSKRDNFELVLQGVENSESKEIIEIGRKDIPLEEMTSQEEYSVQITIPEIKKPEEVAAIINSKINFHWSDYQFFEEKKKNSQNKLRKLKEASLKVNKFLKKVNEIYASSSKSNFNTEQTQASKVSAANDRDFQNNDTFSGKNLNNSNNILNPKKNMPDDLSPENNNIYDNNNQFGVGYEEAKSEYDDRININTKNSSRNSYKNLKGVWLIELLSLLCLLLGLLNSLQRADYISALVGIYIFTYIFFADRKNFAIKSKSFWYLFLLALAAFFLDCFWLYINVDYLRPLIINAGPYDNDIKRLTFFNTGCNAIIKCCLAILMFAQYRLNY